MGNRSVGMGVRFRAMADAHWRLLDDLVEDRRRKILSYMLQEIRWRRELAAHSSPYSAPPPPVCEDTVRMYLMPESRAASHFQ